MTDLHLGPTPPHGVEPADEAVVIGFHPSPAPEDHPQPSLALAPPEGLTPAATSAVLASLRALRARGKPDETVRVTVPRGEGSSAVVVCVGLGEPVAGGFPTDVVRSAAAAGSRALAGRDSGTSLLGLANGSGYGLAATLGAAAEGTLLGAYAYQEHVTPGPETRAPVGSVTLLVPESEGPDGAAARAVRSATAVGAAVTRARDWVNAPPNTLAPDTLARAAQSLGAVHGLDVTVWGAEELRQEGFGGITAVGQGSANPPRLVRVQWQPPSAVVRVALVGKGITFDSGGLSLKPPASMTTMKADMGGAAAVLSAVVGAAELGIPAQVTAWLALAENMPSGTAQRPGDVIRIYGGKTVEVLNTDAEGRLVLADGIAKAYEDAPDHLVVVATLTGAQGIALGARTSGVMGDDVLRDRVVAAADSVGDLMWAMPLPADVRRTMDSPVADIANIGDGTGGMLAGGHFLKEFVPEGASWAHVDVARPAFNTSEPYGWNPKGATGVPVRTLLSLIGTLAADTGQE